MAATRKYPWEYWFSNPVTKIVRGVDYHCSQAMMWQMVRNNIRTHRMTGRVRVTDINYGLIIEVLSENPHTNPTAFDGEPQSPALV